MPASSFPGWRGLHESSFLLAAGWGWAKKTFFLFRLTTKI
jgi:hypothetical protein